MFGYVRPDVGRLTVADYEYYKAVYCGVCRDLGRVCGPAARLCLSYDVAFLELLSLRLGGGDPPVVRKRCPVNPLIPRNMICGTEESGYAAAVCGILADLKIRDDREDEKGVRRAAAAFANLFSEKWIRGAGKICPGLEEELCEKIAAFSREEEKAASEGGEVSCDTLAGAFGELLGCVCARPFRQKEMKNEASVAAAVGRCVGRWIYITDALDDLKKDAEKGRFNPLSGVYEKDELNDEEKQTVCCLAAGEAGEALDALSLIEEKEGSSSAPGRIIENILRSGMPAVTSAVLSGDYSKPGRDSLVRSRI